MAYADFHLAPATGFAPALLPAPRPAPEALLSAVERQVIVLARGDSVSSLRPAGSLDRLAKALFGLRRPNFLADPRLEAMRRLAVLARRRGARRVAQEIPRFLASGYRADQADAVLSLATAS